jgi:hypothetical protein
LASLLLVVASAAAFASGPAFAQTKSSTSTISPTGTKSLTVAPDSGGGGCGANMICVTPGPTPSPTPQDSSPSEGTAGASRSALNVAIWNYTLGTAASGVSSPLAFNTSHDFPSLSGISPTLLFSNPLNSILMPTTWKAENLLEMGEPQRFVCYRGRAVPQLVWMSGGPSVPLGNDSVGFCATEVNCNDGAPVSYPFSVANDIAVLSCSDVVVAGGAYRSFALNNQIAIKNAFAWRSSRVASGDATRFLHNLAGCQTADLWNAISCSGATNCAGQSCNTRKIRAAEAFDISSNGLNIVGEVFNSSSAPFPANDARKEGVLWRGLFDYPAGASSDAEGLIHPDGRTKPVSSTNISDAFILRSNFNSPFLSSNPSFAEGRGLSVLVGAPAIAGISRSSSEQQSSNWVVPQPINGSGGFQLGGLRGLSGVQTAGIQELFSSEEVINQTDLIGVGASIQSDGAREANIVSLPGGAPRELAPVRHRVFQQDGGMIEFSSTRATAMTADGRYAAGHVFDPAAPIYIQGTTDQSWYLGFNRGYPVIWSTDPARQDIAPSVIPTSSDTFGAIVWDVASYGANQAIVVGTLVRKIGSTITAPEGFISVCNRGTGGSFCCREAQSIESYLRARGVLFPPDYLGDTKFMSANAVKVHENSVYISGAARLCPHTGSCEGVQPKAVVARAAFSNSCVPTQCS